MDDNKIKMALKDKERLDFVEKHGLNIRGIHGLYLGSGTTSFDYIELRDAIDLAMQTSAGKSQARERLKPEPESTD